MYSRSTDRGGRRIKLPPGYDGSAFRHDTGEIRRFAEDTGTKVHSPAEERGLPAEEPVWIDKTPPEPHREDPAPASAERGGGAGEPAAVIVPEEEKHTPQAWMDGLLTALGSEDWLILLVILLLVADGSDAWDVILLLAVLLAVH